jgi:hypothetical protein
MSNDEFFNVKNNGRTTVLKMKENSTNVFNMKGSKNDVITTYMLKMGLDIDDMQKLMPTKKHKKSFRHW